jgi:hypothetical protein
MAKPAIPPMILPHTNFDPTQPATHYDIMRRLLAAKHHTIFLTGHDEGCIGPCVTREREVMSGG